MGISKHTLPRFLTVLILFGFLTVLPGRADESRLLAFLSSSGHNTRVRPVLNYNDSVQVEISISIKRINELNIHTGVLDMVVWQELSWIDNTLVWDPDSYGGIQKAHLSSRYIWTPDIGPLHSVDVIIPTVDKPVWFSSDGQVNWASPIHLRIECGPPLKQFPFDEYMCISQFGSWIYDSSSLRLKKMGLGVDLEQYVLNKQWFLLEPMASIIHYDDPPNPYNKLEIVLRLRRRGNYYNYVFVLPVVFVGLLIPLQCFIPPDSDEKLSVGGALFISMILLATALNDVLPTGRMRLPYMCIYYSLLMVWISLSLAIGMVVKNIAGGKNTRKQMPTVFRQVLLPFMRKIFLVEEGPCCNAIKQKAPPVRMVDQEMDGTTNESKLTTQEDSGHFGKDVESISSHLKSLTECQNQLESRTSIQIEWYQLAVACDRLVCILCVITVAIFCLAMFT